MRIKPYLQLVRLPNLFTAGTQSLAGWLLAGGTLHEWRSWLALVLASLTVDLPVVGQRYRDVRNGISGPRLVGRATPSWAGPRPSRRVGA